ncbi:hypothetical protein E2C01_023252 [Portunus trituberculatus]|uniref:Uncharacterized protein n=1 Tax=Portunus trituberculatus TaxID=210409 RepID=A0A5B7E8B4_PORTR|nr:hypothetical protein [Portunus trituberculatus]
MRLISDAFTALECNDKHYMAAEVMNANKCAYIYVPPSPQRARVSRVYLFTKQGTQGESEAPDVTVEM